MKQAQVQMGENIIILFIFFILLIFGIVFFARIQTVQTEQAIEEDVSARALQVAQQVISLPEVQCSKENAEIPGCYDEYNVLALAELAKRGENTAYYTSIFKLSRISIEKIFPSPEPEIVIYDNPKEDFTSIIPTRVPMLLCNYNSPLRRGDCSFAILEVEVYD